MICEKRIYCVRKLPVRGTALLETQSAGLDVNLFGRGQASVNLRSVSSCLSIIYNSINAIAPSNLTKTMMGSLKSIDVIENEEARFAAVK